MGEILKDNKQKLIFVLLTVFGVGLFAHGYCFFNQFYSHDSLLVFQNDVEWQISLGRFLHPVYFLFRGNYYPPVLVGGLSLFFLGISSYLIVELLEIKKKISVFLVSTVMVTSTTFTLINATYMHDIDIYMLSLLFSVIAVYLIVKVKNGIYLAPVFFVFSLGLYQAFIQCSIALLIILAINHLLCGKDARQVFLEGVKWIACVCAGLVIYSVVNKSVLYITGVEYATSYNGLTRIVDFTDLIAIKNAVLNTYHVFLLFLFSTDYLHEEIMVIINIVLILLSAYRVIFLIKCKNIDVFSTVLIFLVLILVPLGFGITCFISSGMFHGLMAFSFCFVYIMVISVGELFRNSNDIKAIKMTNFLLDSWNKNNSISYIKFSLEFFLIVVLSFNNCIFSNHVYLKKDLDYQSTLFTMTRIVDRIESAEGFNLKTTPVVFVGNLNDSIIYNGYNSMNGNFIGVSKLASVTYYDTYSWYLNRLLSYSITILDEDTAIEFAQKSEVKAMPTFPAKDSCQIIDGVLVVKVADSE